MRTTASNRRRHHRHRNHRCRTRLDPVLLWIDTSVSKSEVAGPQINRAGFRNRSNRRRRTITGEGSTITLVTKWLLHAHAVANHRTRSSPWGWRQQIVGNSATFADVRNTIGVTVGQAFTLVQAHHCCHSRWLGPSSLASSTPLPLQSEAVPYEMVIVPPVYSASTVAPASS